jgi:hypothetical protein
MLFVTGVLLFAVVKEVRVLLLLLLLVLVLLLLMWVVVTVMAVLFTAIASAAVIVGGGASVVVFRSCALFFPPSHSSIPLIFFLSPSFPPHQYPSDGHKNSRLRGKNARHATIVLDKLFTTKTNRQFLTLLRKRTQAVLAHAIYPMQAAARLKGARAYMGHLKEVCVLISC